MRLPFVLLCGAAVLPGAPAPVNLSPATPPPPASLAPPVPPARLPAPLPSLAEFAVTPAVTGAEAAFLDEVARLLPLGWTARRDAFGSLVACRGPAPAGGAVRRLIAVGIDEPGYVVSQVRGDGWLRVRGVGRSPNATFALAHEGQAVRVLARGGAVAGVITVNSVHFRAPRPEVLGEEHLFLDVGADDPADVAALGIELLDPVVRREIVALRDGRVAGPSLGGRAAALALLAALRDLPDEAAGPPGALAVVFVAQSTPGTGVLGRGGDGATRGAPQADVLVLRGRGDLPAGAAGPQPLAAPAAASAPGSSPAPGAAPPAGPAPAWSALELRVGNAGSAVETVALQDLADFTAALAAELRR